MDAKGIVLAAALLAIAGSGAASNVSGPAGPAGRERQAGHTGGSAGHRRGDAGHVEDDYAGALAQARRRGVPILVDVWAPW